MQCQLTQKIRGSDNHAGQSLPHKYINLSEKNLHQNLSLAGEEKENMSVFFPHDRIPPVWNSCLMFQLLHLTSLLRQGPRFVVRTLLHVCRNEAFLRKPLRGKSQEEGLNVRGHGRPRPQNTGESHLDSFPSAIGLSPRESWQAEHIITYSSGFSGT